MFMSVAEVLVYQKPVFIKSSLSLHQLTLNTTGIRSIFAMYEKYFTDMIFLPEYTDLQARLRQYMNLELPDVKAGFRKGRGTRDHTANMC